VKQKVEQGMTNPIRSRNSWKSLGVALSLSLLLVACGSDDKKDDGQAGSNNPVVTPTATISAASTMQSLGIQPGAVMDEPGAADSGDAAPTVEIVMTEQPGFQVTPSATEPRRGSDGSMSNQALGTPPASGESSPVTAAGTPGAGGTPVASPVASPNASPENGTPVTGN
jgi:hypothetical protein